MQTTNNLGLRKPSENDFIDIEDLNYNAQKLDEKVKEIVENIEGLSGLKDSIQLTTDAEFVNSLINNTAKAGSVLLFSNGERNGNISGENYTLYAGLANCNQYSGCDITVKAINMEEQSLHPMFFQSPNFFIAKVDKQNAKKVVIYPLGGGNVEELRERLDSVEEKANQAFTQAGEGKSAIVEAFTGLGISASSSETFKSLADKIKNKALNKEKIANALTNKGVPTSTTASAEQIIKNIGNLSTVKTIKATELAPSANSITILNSGRYRYRSDAKITIHDGWLELEGREAERDYPEPVYTAFIFNEPLNLTNHNKLYMGSRTVHFNKPSSAQAGHYYLIKNKIAEARSVKSGIIVWQGMDISSLTGDYYIAFYSDSVFYDGTYNPEDSTQLHYIILI